MTERNDNCGQGMRFRPRVRLRLARAERARRPPPVQRALPRLLDAHLPQDLAKSSG